MKITKNYIWDYDVKNLDLSKKDVLLWYLKRKIEHGDWEVLDRETLRKYLKKIKINPNLKKILNNFLKKSG